MLESDFLETRFYKIDLSSRYAHGGMCAVKEDGEEDEGPVSGKDSFSRYEIMLKFSSFETSRLVGSLSNFFMYLFTHR